MASGGGICDATRRVLSTVAAVDQHGAELDILLQKRRDKAAAKRFFKRVLAACPEVPCKIVTDQLRSYLNLLVWAQSFGTLRRAGVEGTGTYGAGLTRVLLDHEIEVWEVNRPHHADRRFRGKFDTTDAESTARAVLSGKAAAIPKDKSGAAEAMRAVAVARRSAVKAKTQAINQLRSLLVSAPQDIRERLSSTKMAECVANCARVRSLGNTPMLQTLASTLRLLAKRWIALEEELKALDAMLEKLTSQYAPRLRERFGVGPHTAAILVTVAGDNAERLKNEASLAALCGASPL